MAREFSYYYVPTTVRGINNFSYGDTSVNTSNINTCTVFMGIRLQNMVLTNKNFYRSIGFLSDETIQNLLITSIPTPTVITFSDQADAMRAGLLRRVKFTLVPTPGATPTSTAPASMNLYLLYPYFYTDFQIAESLIRFPFTFESVNYRVVPRSIKPFKSKDTTTGYSGFGGPPTGYPTPTSDLPET